jgi:hypothetical protein
MIVYVIILRSLTIEEQVRFTVEPLKIVAKVRNLQDHINSRNIYNKLVSIGWLVIQRFFLSIKISSPCHSALAAPPLLCPVASLTYRALHKITLHIKFAA